MAHLRTEIEKIFDEIDKDLQNNEENSMTIYDCFDFQEEDKDDFLNLIFTLVVLFNNNIKSNFACRLGIANKIIEVSPTLAEIIIEKLCDRNFISFGKCKDICDFLDKEWEEYTKQNPPTPLKEVAKDYPYLDKLMKACNKKV